MNEEKEALIVKKEALIVKGERKLSEAGIDNPGELIAESSSLSASPLGYKTS